MIDYVARFYGFKTPSMQQLKENYENKVVAYSNPGFYSLGQGKYGETLSVFVNASGEKYFVDKVVIDEGVCVTSKTFVASQAQDGTFTEAIMHHYSAPTINELRYTGQTLSQEGIMQDLTQGQAECFFEDVASQFEQCNIEKTSNQFQSTNYFLNAPTQ